MSKRGEQACSYAAMLLQSDGKPITEENIGKLLKAANIEIESYWPSLFCKALSAKNVDEIVATPVIGGNNTGAAFEPQELKEPDVEPDIDIYDGDEEPLPVMKSIFGDDEDDY